MDCSNYIKNYNKKENIFKAKYLMSEDLRNKIKILDFKGKNIIFEYIVNKANPNLIGTTSVLTINECLEKYPVKKFPEKRSFL